MARSLVATGVQYAVAFLVGLPIFAAFKLARRALRRGDSVLPLSRVGDETRA